MTEAFREKIVKTSVRSVLVRQLTQPSLSLDRQWQRAWQFVEDLGDGITLEMVMISEGRFLMGAPKTEAGSGDSERPQHWVTVKPFVLGKYPVTQAQWRAVAVLPQVNRELESDPSRFKGDDCPVEQVSWLDAVEFCDRLSRNTGKHYRLPSEAEWEYACRSGTTTPFHFGETLTTDLANYDGNYTYGAGPKGTYRKQTTAVGSFPANGLGLYDMHGNVWEWCADRWHENYEGAPIDGSAWLTRGNEDLYLPRGGSWFLNLRFCRSACRYWYDADYWNDSIGFRVACSA